MLRRFTLSRTVLTLLMAAALVVSLTPLQAQDTAARVLVMSGSVSVLRDSGPWILSEGSAIKPKQIVKTGHDGYAKFQVSDGSTFEVFPDSQVTFRDNPGSLRDLLDVVIGHVKVYIQHLNGENPNKVYSPTAVISVRGTVFEVVVEDEDGTTLVSVEEGSVGVRNRILGGETFLQPGESVRVYRNQRLAKGIDRGAVLGAVWRAAKDAMYQVILRRPGGMGGGGTSGTVPQTGGAQGDKGKNGGTSPGTPPAPPGAPPAPPGG
jgi:ferric-dicitrate binding protein FerR (iron transport regulator)